MNATISIVKCKSYDPAIVLESTREAVNLLGGITAYIKPASKVLIKPNLLIAIEPRFSVTTHPEVVRAVVKILKEINCKIFLGDGPSMSDKRADMIDKVYEQTGMRRIAEEENIELVRFNKKRWRGKFPLTTWLDECEYFISIPKFKTHQLMVLTAAIKNLFGLVSYTFKKEIHRQNFMIDDFARAIVDIYEEVRPTLTIIDGVIAMEGDGPATSGILRNTGLLFAGSDCVALDSILAFIMGLTPYDIATNREAVRRGLGVADINSIQIRGESLKECVNTPFLLPKTSIITKIPTSIIEIARRFIRFYPAIDYKRCTQCNACMKACPQKIITRKGRYITVDYPRCIACFCCQEVCPASAIKIEKSFLAKIYGFVTSTFQGIRMKRYNGMHLLF